MLQRQPFLSSARLECIQETVLRILEEVGVAVLEQGLLQRLKAQGFRAHGNRVLVKRQVAQGFLDAEREHNGNRFSECPAPASANVQEITVDPNPYAQSVHEPESDRIVPLTVEQLIEAAKLVDVLHERGVRLSPPGCPADLSPALQPVAQYWVAATYSRQGRRPVDPKSRLSFPYVAEMGEVLGHPIRHLPVYVFSPLTLGGESLLCVLKFKERLSSVHVCSMPSVGCTAPVNVGDAFAVAAAEVIGSALLLQEALGLATGWSIQLFPMDFVSMAMVFGSPEAELLQLMSCEVDAYFHGIAWSQAGGTIHTMAKLPGAQACAEKASVMTLNALLGQRSFSGAGALSLDEVFSAEQLLYDLEIKDHVERLIHGLEGGCEAARCLEEVAESLRQGSFLGLQSTARACREFWRPALFERSFLGRWVSDGQRTVRSRAHRMVRDLISRHEYRLDVDLQRELDKVFARAKACLS